MNIKRLFDLFYKLWLYTLRCLENPFNVIFILKHVALNKVHLGELLNLLKHKKFILGMNINTVIDVGANKGQFISAINAMIPHAKIYAFEPIPQCFNRLEKNFSNYPNINITCAAIGERCGNIQFYLNDFAESSSILEMGEVHKENFPWTKQVSKIEVDLLTLDSVINSFDLKKKVLLKIDVQGYEKYVLDGANMMLKYVDLIIVETSFQQLYDNQSSFDEIYSKLKLIGFTFIGNIDQLISPVDSSILQGDALFIKNQE